MAIIGPDLITLKEDKYSVESAITNLVKNYCKFNRFITEKYNDLLEKYHKLDREVQKDKIPDLDRRTRACLGFCVENFAKIKIYSPDINFIFKKFNINNIEVNHDIKIVHCAMKIYHDQMVSVFGHGVEKLIKVESVEDLIKKNRKKFIDIVVKYGYITTQFILGKLYPNKYDQNTKIYDPRLSFKHLKGLCDFIKYDTIIDVKCKKIEEDDFKQNSAYHYLSTKRTDLNIKKLIILEAIEQQYIEIDLVKRKVERYKYEINY